MTDSTRLTGRVKWFNSKTGYGFITVSDDDGTSRDIFVHYSNVKVNNIQYTYLVQGEYVEFDLTETTNNANHTHQAVNITGIKGGPIMCETRHLNQMSFEDDENRQSRPVQRTASRSQKVVRTSSAEDKEGYTEVKKRRVMKK